MVIIQNKKITTLGRDHKLHSLDSHANHAMLVRLFCVCWFVYSVLKACCQKKDRKENISSHLHFGRKRDLVETGISIMLRILI